MIPLPSVGSTFPDPNSALQQATQFGDLAYVLVLAMLLLTGIVTALCTPIIFKGILPWMRAKREREDKLADSHIENLKVSNETQTKMVLIMDGMQDAHTQFRNEVQAGFSKVHDRLDGLCGRHKRPDDPNQPPNNNHRPH